MTKVELKSSEVVQGTNEDTLTVGETTEKDKVNAYTDLQQDRFYSIYHIYDAVALEIVDYYTTRKIKGIWESFLTVSSEVNNGAGEERALYERVTKAFELGTPYTNHDIITTIIKVRKDLKLPPLTTAIPKACLELFETLFLCNEFQRTSQDGKSKYIEYTPVVAVLVYSN